MFIGAGIGLVVNLIIIFALNGESSNLNVKATLLHVMGDLGASAGVIVAGIIIYFTDFQWIDPLLSILIALLVAYSAWNIIRQSFRILMEATPKGIQLEEIAENIKRISGIKGVHDLHIWTLTGDRHFLTCHVVLDEGVPMSKSPQFISQINKALKNNGIHHSTIQMEDCQTSHRDHLICTDLHDHDHDHHHHESH
ncbi:cation diffusion facilitator family transporter [Pullulanibacillus sp. KACC 23026]|uniref:cation diffusion facilitator family transporter n=1 Tax=Pullulanibacillus sp. KACC 23026 TaxID=3028315 RepID=UPI0023AEC666|nr:cation diffusion facilitator family transporter [Pullulanibacillus sp. KACC 23026]WEG12146.1 cation diffusion facilitator family transporter [Pullulanibacillus sp. KACC 23026]